MRALIPLRVRTAAAAALLAAGVSACGDFLAAPAAAPARLSVSYSLAPAARATNGPGRAFDRVDAVHVRLLRGETVLLADSFAAAPADSGVIRGALQLPLERAEEELRLAVELRWQGRALFTGAEDVRLVRGANTAAEVGLHPVPAEVSITSVPAFRSLGDTLQAAAVATFATGDTMPASALAWSGPDGAVLEVLPDGRLVARAEGHGRLVVAVGEARAEAVVTVRAAVASMAVSPDTATVMRADSLAFRATARDARGNALVRTVTWSTVNPPIAAVEPSGVARGVAPGQARIRATAEGVSGEGRLTVVPRRGAISVEVENALDGQAVAGATVTARPGPNAEESGPVSGTATTSAAGRARLAALDEGVYTLFVSAPGMITAIVRNVTVAPDAEGQQRAVVSPVLPAGQTRIVLTWGAEPHDLDSHLTGPNGSGGRFHVYYSSRRFFVGTTTAVELDVDATSGFGPETITIHQQFTGSYCFSVHLYDGTGSLGTSGAQVRVFRGSQQVATFAVPNTTNRVWTVFGLNGSTITPVNTTGSTVPGVCP